MKILSGWFATLGVSGGVALAGVLAIGGGTVALHQSSLLIRSHAMPLVIQPVSTVSSSNGATQADDRGVDANQAADDRGVDVNQAGSDRGPSGSVQPSATSSPSGSDDRGGDSHGGGSSSDDGK
jgi:hypothetical protein